MSKTRGPEAWSLCAETVWLLTAEEMAVVDREAVDSGATTERTLIETAGREIARRVQEWWPEGPVLAVAGSGHNGADALVALRTLRAWGREVRAVQAGREPPDPGAFLGWDVPLEPADRIESAAVGASVVLDGILGTGTAGAPRDPQATLISRINELGVPVAAVDGPSGVDFTTGAVPGACVRADLTVSLGWPTVGLLRHPARSLCGRIEAVEIGFPPLRTTPGARAITGRWVASRLPRRPPDAHKGRAGYLLLTAGQEGMAGACLLAARSALRGGLGILKVASDPRNRDIVQESVPGAIFLSWDDAESVAAAVNWAGALAIGPGLGTGSERRELVERLLGGRGERPVVLDADGLNAFEGEPKVLAALLRPGDVVTPHPGELARLMEMSIDTVLADPPAAARAAVVELGCVVVLKGAPTLVAEAEAPLLVSTTGGPALAAGGTGDVLTGLIGAYLAGGLGASDAAAAGLFLSGLAAEGSAEPAGHLASDVPDRLPELRSKLGRLGSPAGPVIFVSEACGAPPPVADGTSG